MKTTMAKEQKNFNPPTMLFSLFGDHPDVRFTATSDLKREGERLYHSDLANKN